MISSSPTPTHRALTRVGAPLARLARHWHDMLFALLALALICAVTWDAVEVRMITAAPGADYWEHTAVLRALIEDPFRPEHPMLGGPIGSPRFSPHYVLVALVSRAAGFDPLDAMGLAAVLNTTLFVLGIQLFFRSYFKNPYAPLLGLVVMFGTWVDAPHFSNVYELRTYFSVAGYPSSAALALTLLGFALELAILRSPRERKGLLALLTAAWAYVFITHPLTAMMTLSGAVILALTEPGVERRRRLLAAATVPVALLLSLFWPYYPAIGMVAGGTVDRVQSKLASEAAHELHRFYEYDNLRRIIGYALPGVLCVPWFLYRRIHLFLALGPLVTLSVFIVSAFVPIPLGHRFVLLSMPYFHASTVWLLLELLKRRERPAWLTTLPARAGLVALVTAFFAYLTITNVKSAAKKLETAERRHGERESATVRFARRVGQLVTREAVVLADPLTSWALPTFGVRVVAFHHQNPLVRDANERNRATARFFAGATDDERAETLERYGVTHVIATGRERAADRYLAPRAKRVSLPRGARLYVLRAAGAPSRPRDEASPASSASIP